MDGALTGTPPVVPMIFYLHGFRSAPASIKAQQLLGRMQALGLRDRFWCPQLPVSPRAAMALVEGKLAACADPPVLVGSSLGGFYATHLAQKHDLRAVPINPVVAARRSPDEFLGVHENLYSGETFEFTAKHADELRALEVERITRPERYLLIVGSADELLDYRDALAHYAGARQIVVEGGDHGLIEFERHVDDVLRWAGLTA